MANQQRNLAPESIFQRFWTSAIAFLNQLRERETWQTLWHWGLWRVIPKRRRILKLIQELQPLHANAPPEMRALRDEVFSKSCLELKRPEQEQVLLDTLTRVHQPLGFEQIFFAAIYPVLIKRDMVVIPITTETPHRLDVEIGYLGHNEDYFFWVLEIDGTKRLTLNTPLNPRMETREDKRYVVYSLGSSGLVDTDFTEYAEQWLLDSPRLTIALPLLAAAYADQWILNAHLYLAHILTDLKKRNYKVTAMTIPDFERERLSLLRRLSLDRLRKRQLLSERRNR
ncbi:MAG: hypothetical protein OXL96_21955 [Candidatus Poribacteria bacterium]|nr:hypothetical protein [Candidatus Poribacteria bacterium]